MLSELSVYLRGSCRFTASGRFPERFMNLCARSDMGLWAIRREGDGINAHIIASRYRRLRPLAKKCGLRLHVTGRYGLPFRLLPYRRRAGMPLGFLMFCAMIWFLSLFIWSVELPTLSTETSAKLESALGEMGVSVGSLRSGVDGERMSVELQLRIPELTWAGISTRGSSVCVEAKELEPFSEAPDDTQPCNVVAASDGVVLSVELVHGSIAVKPGQTVASGDLLISGVVDTYGGHVSIVHAQGSVWAKTWRTLRCEIPLEQQVQTRNGRVVTIRRIRLFGLEIPIYSRIDTSGSYEREYSKWQLHMGSTALPLEVNTERWHELSQTVVVRTPEQAEAEAMSQLERMKSELGLEILAEQLSVARTDAGVTVTAELTVREDIARSAAITVQ